MKIKSVVKVMNFHALLRVDKARKNAERYFEYENELTDFTDDILNNRNLILDKKVLKLNKQAKPLNIYIGNDLGFCGNFNSNVNKMAEEEPNCNKIIIGKKIFKLKENAILQMSKEEYLNDNNKIEQLLYDVVNKGKASEINIIYNHYHNISDIELVKKKLLPIENTKAQKGKYYEDFTVEGDLNSILINIITLYLSYEIKIATENSYASENIMRQSITKQSLKKIDEIETEEKMEIRKEKNNESFKKVIDNFIKLTSKEGKDE